MSRKPAKKQAMQGKRPAGVAPRRAASLVGVAALLAMGGLLSWWLGGTPRAPGGAGPGLDPQFAYREGLALGKQGRFLESLPLLKRVIEAEPNFSQGHHDYATALLNAVHQGRHHLGRDEFAVRAAPERVAMVRAALAELVEAERVAGNNAHDLAWARRTRGQAMRAWGFHWESFVAYRQAEWTDPSWRDVSGMADHIMDELEHPERDRARGSE